MARKATKKPLDEGRVFPELETIEKDPLDAIVVSDATKAELAAGAAALRKAAQK